MVVSEYKSRWQFDTVSKFLRERQRQETTANAVAMLTIEEARDYSSNT